MAHQRRRILIYARKMLEHDGIILTNRSIRRNPEIKVLRVRTNCYVIGQIYPMFKNCGRHLMGAERQCFAGSALGLRGVSLGASRGQPWGFAGSALVFGLSNEAGWRRGPDNRPRRATQADRCTELQTGRCHGNRGHFTYLRLSSSRSRFRQAMAPLPASSAGIITRVADIAVLSPGAERLSVPRAAVVVNTPSSRGGVHDARRRRSRRRCSPRAGNTEGGT